MDKLGLAKWIVKQSEKLGNKKRKKSPQHFIKHDIKWVNFYRH